MNAEDSSILPEEVAPYAAFWRRLVATIIDGILLGILQVVIVEVLNMPTERPNMLGVLGNVAIGWLYEASMESSTRQATLGKMAMGLQVTGMQHQRISFMQATGRHFGKYLSAIIFSIGFLVALFTEKNQALHDLLAKTIVTHKASRN